MAQYEELPGFPGYITVKDAAGIIDISETRAYNYIDDGRLRATRIGGTYVVKIEDAENFKLNPPGRQRKRIPPWRKFSCPTKLQTTEISVKIKEGQGSRLREKLEAIRKEQRHNL